jgi:hypothetical protein
MAAEAVSYEPEAADEPAPKSKVLSGGGRPTVYKTKDGKRVPGCTTVTKRFTESGGLIQWAYNCGRDGIDMNKARDDAADAGHLAHAWVDDTIHGRPLSAPPPELGDEQIAGARNALEAFTEWRDQVNLEIIATEVALVSEALRFGGTFDAIFRIKRSRLVLGDWKSGNRVYGDHLAQLGGYGLLIEENNFLEQFGGGELEGIQLLRFDKEFGSFAHFSWPKPVLDLGKHAFREMRGLYDVCARLKKAVG